MSKVVKTALAPVTGGASFLASGRNLGLGSVDPGRVSINRAPFNETILGRGQDVDDLKREQQNVEALQRQARGFGPSVAQSQLQTATERNLAAALAQAASQRGVSGGLAAREAGRQRARASQEAARQSAQIRAVESQQAQQGLTGAIQQLRQRNLGAREFEVRSRQRGEEAAAGIASGNIQRQFQAEQGTQQRRAGFTSGILQGGAALFSDKNLKKDIKEADDRELFKFAQAIKPKSFKFKDEQFGEGEQMGVVAQDLEKEDIGKQLVSETEDGIKALDLKKTLQTSLALQSVIARKLAKLDKTEKKDEDAGEE